ncbi:hypothetical protein ACRCUN_25230 [Mycobacterium sp. LTG2003]
MLDTSPDEEVAEQTPWHESDWAMVVAGVGGLLVIGLLAFAVFMTSHQSTLPVLPHETTTSTVTTASITRHTTSSWMTHPVPVTTSELTEPAIIPPAPQAPPATSSEPATTTMTNPYATTTVANAGAV